MGKFIKELLGFNPWPFVVVALVSASMTGTASWKLHKLSVASIEKDHKSDLDKQKLKLGKQCDKDKAITSEVSREYQKQLGGLRFRADARRMRVSATCVPVAAGIAAGRDGGTGGAADGRAHGVDPQTLRDFAVDAERYRQQLIACQAYIRKTEGPP